MASSNLHVVSSSVSQGNYDLDRMLELEQILNQADAVLGVIDDGGMLDALPADEVDKLRHNRAKDLLSLLRQAVAKAIE